MYYAFLFTQTGRGGEDLKYKEEIDNVRVSLQWWSMNNTEIKNDNAVIVHVDQTKGEIVDIKLIYSMKINNY